MDYTDYDTRLAAYALILDGAGDERRVLLALWNEADEPAWTMPGGGVELHETVEEAAVREVREESGYDVRLGRLLGVDSFTVPGHERANGSGRELKSVRVVFEAEVVGGELAREVGGTTDESRWIPVAEVPSLNRVPLVDASLRMAGLA